MHVSSASDTPLAHSITPARHSFRPQPPLIHRDRSVQSYYYSPKVGPHDVNAVRFGYSPGGADVHIAGDGALLSEPAPEAALPEEATFAAREGLQFCTDDDDSRPTGRDPTCSTYDLTADVRGGVGARGARAGVLLRGRKVSGG